VTRSLSLAAALLAAAGCVVTRAPYQDERPRWRIEGGDRFEAGCAIGRAFLRKSGKTGFGVALQWKSRGDCRVAIEAVRLSLARGPAIAVPAISPIELPGRSLVYAWLPVPFDNNAAWNDGLDDGTLELAVAVAGAPAVPWQIPVHQHAQRRPGRAAGGGPCEGCR
jgi:hypothetical protein